jgi:hypothetical protein
MHIQDAPVATIIYPKGPRLSLLSLIQACDEEHEGEPSCPEGSFSRAFQVRLGAIDYARKLGRTPIVGVCGTVNSGKSTVVSGFLSDVGRPRVLVGTLAKEGTHRFVFWLPLSWRTNGLGPIMEEMIASQSGMAPDPLDDDPHEAALQYNDAKSFRVPLVAYDPALDEGGIAFLDCPDIQRSLDETSNQPTAHLRLERLQTIAPLCSAFLVVASMQQAGTEDVGKVFDALSKAASNAPLYFVLNMTNGNEVATYLPEAKQVLKRWGRTDAVKRIYLAPWVHDPERKNTPVRPSITSMDADHVALAEIAGELDPAELQRARYASCVGNLKSLLDEVSRRVLAADKEKSDRAMEAQQRVCLFLGGKFVDEKGSMMSLLYEKAARLVAESLKRTAPKAIRVSLWPAEAVQSVKLRLSKFKRREATDADVEKYVKVKPTDFADFLMGNRFLSPDVESKTLERVWSAAMRAVKSHADKGFSDQQGLDAITRSMWGELSFLEKVKLLRGILLAMAVIAIAGALSPFDGGASTILVLAGHPLAFGMAEIMAILLGGPLAGTILAAPDARALMEKFEREIALPQMDVLYAALVDGLGIPRQLDDSPTMSYKNSVVHRFKLVPDVPIQKNEVSALQGSLVRLDEPAWKEVMRTLDEQTI